MAEDKPKYYYRIKDVPLVPLTDKVGTRFIKGDNVLLSFIERRSAVVVQYLRPLVCLRENAVVVVGVEYHGQLHLLHA